MSADKVDQIFEIERARIQQRELLELIDRLRVPSRREDRPWDYGSPGQTHPCFIVPEQAVRYWRGVLRRRFRTSVSPGLLFLTRFPSMGMDSGWFATLEDAVRESMAWDGENPEGYEVG